MKMNYYKVIVLKCDMIETIIIDERHFRLKVEADSFADQIKDKDNIAIVMFMTF